MEKPKDILVTEIWEYDKETHVCTKPIAFLADGRPIKVYDGVCVSVTVYSYDHYKTVFGKEPPTSIYSMPDYP